MKFWWRKLKVIPLTVMYSWLGMSICYLPSIFVFLYMSNCVHHNVQNMVYDNYLVYFSVLSKWCRVFNEKMLWGNYNYSQDRSLLTGNEENPTLVLSNIYKRTSARDCLMFGFIGLFMFIHNLAEDFIQPLWPHTVCATISPWTTTLYAIHNEALLSRLATYPFTRLFNCEENLEYTG